MSALGLSYEQYIEINGGERCGICGRKPSLTRRLDRDHAHTIPPIARGLLCGRCNRALPSWVTVAWLQAAIAYLERAKERVDVSHAQAD